MLAYKRILVPVDFSDISRSAISQAANHSEASESELLVVHIVDDSVQSSDTDLRIRDAESQLTDLLDSLEIGYCEKLVELGDTVPRLLQIIKEQKIDLVVMGTHTGIPVSPLIRSMTVEVVTHTECDILVLHK